MGGSGTHPFPGHRAARVKTGTHHLTVRQRYVLTTALMVLEDWKEYPSISILCSILDQPRQSLWLRRTMNLLESKGLLPFKRKRTSLFCTDRERSSLVQWKQSGYSRAEIARRFVETFGRPISRRHLSEILRDAGVVRVYHRQSVPSLEDRKARVIAQREGFAPRKLEEPLAYARACRRSRSR